MDWVNLAGIKVLVVDDEPSLCQLVEMALARAGAEVTTAMTGRGALRQFCADRPDVVILDIMMPDMNGLQVCAEMMRLACVPVILLTALSGEDETVRGLAAGAIDYVTKPFSVKVLTARVAAAMRRNHLPIARTDLPAYNDGYLYVDVASGEVAVEGEEVNLTPIEHRLLACLVENPGNLVPVEDILVQVWGQEYCNSPNYVHVYVSRLRSKLDPPTQARTYLDNVRGNGYRFVPRNGLGAPA